MINELYVEQDATTKIFCSVKDCDVVIFTVRDDRDGINLIELLDGEANVICGKHSTVAFNQLRLQNEQ